MLKTARDVGDQKNASFALLGMGLILHEQGDLAGARKRMEEAIKITRDAGMKGDYAAGLNALGDIDLAQDHLENAAKNYRESLQLNQQLEDKSGQASNNAAMAWLGLEENRPAEAEGLASKAADAFKGQKNGDLKTDGLGTVVGARVDQGKLGEAPKALEV